MANKTLTDLIVGDAVAQTQAPPPAVSPEIERPPEAQPPAGVGAAHASRANDGLAQDYMDSSQERQSSDSAQEMEEWVRAEGFVEGGQTVTSQTYADPDVAVAATEQELEPFPTDRQAPAEQGVFATVMRNAAEIPRGIVAGANSAVIKITDPFVGPVVNWLETKFGSARIPLGEANTPTGKFTKGLTEFVVTFIPTFRALKAAGAGTKLGGAGAGAIVDAALAEKGAGNIANLWTDLGGDPNVITDAFAANPDDEESLMRVKAAASGLVAGAALEGFVHALRFTRGLLHDKVIKRALDADVERNFGALTEEEITKVVGKDNAPMLVESLERQRGLGAAQMLEEVASGTPTTVGAAIKPKTVEELAADQVVTELRDYVTALPREGMELAQAKIATKKVILEKFASGEISEGSALRSSSMAELKKILDSGELVVGKDAEGVPGISAATIDSEGFPIYNEGVGYLVPKEATTASGRAGEVLVNEALDPRTLRYVVGERIVSFDELKKAIGKKEEQLPVPEVTELGDLDFTKMAKAADLEAKVKSLDEQIAQAQAKPDLVNGKPTAAYRSTLAQLKGEQKATKALLAEAKVAQADKQLAAGPTAEEIQQSYATVKLDEGEVYINMNRLGTADDVKAAIRLVAEKTKGKIDEARRGAITHEETKKMADALGMSVDDLLARRQGQSFNAEEITAARRLWVASGERMVALAEKASSKNAGALDQYAFRKAMATHSAIGSQVLGASAEAGRALSAHRILAKGAIEQARAINQYLNGLGGSATTEEIAQRLLILKKHGDPAALAKFAEKAWGAKSFDAVREIWINGLLSAPTTHVVNSVSNSLATVLSVAERGLAARIGQVTGTTNGVELGEATTMMYALAKSAKEAFQFAWLALKTGETGKGMGKIDLPIQGAVSSTALGLKQNSALARGTDFLGDWLVRLPGKFLASQDEFFKTINYRMELSAQALRQAMSEGKVGKDLVHRVRELELNPPENMRLSATDAALMGTFANETGNIGKTLLKARQDIPALTFVMPFVKTPVNIARYTFERSPLAPLVGQWRADIAAGGTRADLAVARMSIGTMVMANAFGLADSGKISGKGPRDPGEREAMMRQGWQEYSIQLGGRWYSYNRLDPYGALMGFAADVSEAVRHGEFDEDDVDEWGEVTAMGISATAQVAISKTYLRGISDTFHAVTGKQHEIEGYLNNFASSFLPYTSLAGAVERASDPIMRETNSPWEAIQAKVKGLSDQLPPKMDLWGRPRSSASGIGMDYDVSPEAQKRITQTYDFLSPTKTTKIKPEPIDTEIMRLAPLAGKDNVGGAPPKRIAKNTTFDGVQVSFKKWRDVYVDYVRLAGNESKDPAFNMGCKDYLNAIVTGAHPLSEMYKTIMSDETKIKFINATVERYRKMAQRQIMEDPKHLEFADHVRSIQEAKRAALMPQGVQ